MLNERAGMKKMIFQIGDAVIHPGYGAGIVAGIEKLQCLGSNKQYYLIKLSDESETRVWVSVNSAGEKGIRYLTPMSQLDQIWCILRAGPKVLSSDHDERHGSLQEKLRGGNIFRIAEAVRDMFWDNYHSHRQTILGRELYEKGLMLLTSEIAAMQGCDWAIVKAKISNILGTSLAAKPAGRSI